MRQYTAASDVQKKDIFVLFTLHRANYQYEIVFNCMYKDVLGNKYNQKVTGLMVRNGIYDEGKEEIVAYNYGFVVDKVGSFELVQDER